MFSLGQMFVIGLQGTSVSVEEEKFITNNNIGGVILFDRNIESPEQLFDLCLRLQLLAQSSSAPYPMFISVDMEGGRVQRLKAPYTNWPAVRKLGDLGSAKMAFQFAQSMGEELAATGINLNFAPSIDILTNLKNKVIGDRSAGESVEIVAQIGSALARGYIKANIIPCAKHFPGHGNTLLDSHDELPIEQTSLEVLQQRELAVFKKVLRARVKLVMTSHILFQSIDPEHPVTFSHKLIHDILRQEMRYDGVVITDDLDMGALRKNYSMKEIPVKALNAGCDLLLYCNEPESPQIAFEAVKKAVQDKELDINNLSKSFNRVIELKKVLGKDHSTLSHQHLREVIERKQHKDLATAIDEGRLLEV